MRDGGHFERNRWRIPTGPNSPAELDSGRTWRSNARRCCRRNRPRGLCSWPTPAQRSRSTARRSERLLAGSFHSWERRTDSPAMLGVSRRPVRIDADDEWRGSSHTFIDAYQLRAGRTGRRLSEAPSCQLPNTSQAIPTRGAIVWLLLLIRARFAPGVPLDSGRFTPRPARNLAASAQGVVPGTIIVPLQASDGLVFASEALQLEALQFAQ